MDTHFAVIWESVADAVPNHPAIIQGDRKVSWRDYERRAALLAQGFLNAGLGPNSKVAIYLHNAPEYCETNFAAMKIRGIPINVNYRYLDNELHYLLENADAEALVFHSSLSDRVSRVHSRLPKLRALVEVNDGPAQDGSKSYKAADNYEEFLASTSPATRTEPVGDETYMFYTGGTTGMPKGVIYPMCDFTTFFMRGFPPMVGLDPFEKPSQFAPMAKQMVESGSAIVAMSGPPLMHGTGCWLGLMFPHMLGGTSILLKDRSFNAEEVWDAVQLHRITQFIIVGDAFAKPLLRALDNEPMRWDTSSLRMIISSGAMFTTEVKKRLIKHIPELAIADVLGSTEGGMGQSIMTKDTPDTETAKFSLMPTAKVFLEDGSREVEPGSGEIGLVAHSGMVPIGYYKDPEKSARTFREIDGQRYAFPGDMASVEADGSITLLGRGSNCINTGGEKVFPEEVEEALKLHPAVEDALVFGIPDDHFGNRVAAVVSLELETETSASDITMHTRKLLSSYKLPKELTILESIPRAPNGKPDYQTAQKLFAINRKSQ